jgi:hypothetical protein
LTGTQGVLGYQLAFLLSRALKMCFCSRLIQNY